MHARLLVASLAVALTMVPHFDVDAQSAVRRQVAAPPATTTRAVATLAAPSHVPNSSGAFLIETVGGSLGSLAGMGLVVALTKKCDDDLACTIKGAGVGGVLGVVGATVGTTLAAKHTGSDRSALGAALGGVVGTGAGAGIHWLLNRGTANNIGDWVVVPIFTLSQGAFAAAGSRLLGR